MNELLVRSWMRKPQSEGLDKPSPHFWNELSEVMMYLTKRLAAAPLGLGAHWLSHQYHWLNPARRVRDIRVGDVVEFDLGVNYTGEFSYRHGCIVLHKAGPLVIVVPLTSKDSGKGVRVAGGVIAAAPVDPSPKYRYRVEFQPAWSPGMWNVALVEQVRVLAVDRALFKWQVGLSDAQVAPEVLKAVQQRLAMMATPLVYDMLDSRDATIRNVCTKKKALLDTLKKTQRRLCELESERDALRKELDAFTQSASGEQT